MFEADGSLILPPPSTAKYNDRAKSSQPLTTSINNIFSYQKTGGVNLNRNPAVYCKTKIQLYLKNTLNHNSSTSWLC